MTSHSITHVHQMQKKKKLEKQQADVTRRIAKESRRLLERFAVLRDLQNEALRLRMDLEPEKHQPDDGAMQILESFGKCLSKAIYDDDDEEIHDSYARRVAKFIVKNLSECEIGLDTSNSGYWKMNMTLMLSQVDLDLHPQAFPASLITTVGEEADKKVSRFTGLLHDTDV